MDKKEKKEKKVRSEKRGNVNALSIITLIFAILSACAFFLTALYSVGVTLSDIGINTFMEVYFGSDVSFTTILKEIVSKYWMSLINPVVMIAAGVLILVDRGGAYPFIPVGFLSKVAVGAFLTIPINLISNFVVNRFIGPSEGDRMEFEGTKSLVMSIAFTVMAIIIMVVIVGQGETV